MNWGLIISLAVLAGVGLVGLGSMAIKSWIKVTIEQKISTKFETELEGVRSDLRLKESKIAVLQTSVLGGRAGRQAILDKRRIEAVERVWAAALALDKFNIAVMSISLLKIDEIQKSMAHDSALKQVLDTLSGDGDLKDQMPTNAVEQERPFLPQETWKVFSAYRGLMVYAYVRLKMTAMGLAREEFFKEGAMIGPIKEVMPHMAEYLDKHDIAGAAHLAQPLRQLVFDALQTVLQSNQSDLENADSMDAIMRRLADIDSGIARKN